jgi:hypothetical protein
MTMRPTRNALRHVAAWFLVMVMAVINGTIRDFTYGRWLAERVAHSLSVIPLLVGILAVAFWLARRWPLPSPAATAAVGAIWLLATLAFEFGLGTAALPTDVRTAGAIRSGPRQPVAAGPTDDGPGPRDRPALDD